MPKTLKKYSSGSRTLPGPPRPDDARAALAAGADAHLTTATDPHRLVEALATRGWATGGATVTTDSTAAADSGTHDGRDVPPALGPAGTALLVLAAFVPPWAFWLSGIAHAAGWLGWRLPQGAAL